MYLNHLNLTVTDVDAARLFFQEYFDFICEDKKTNPTLSVMTGKDGFVLVLMNANMNKNPDNVYPDAFHVGFIVDTIEEVETTYKRLLEGNVHIEKAPERMRKNFGFYFHFQDIMMEVTTVVKD
jgi:catechol 2,3-dioxygenase-like lactoylglutathione lyase family enzyme